MNKCVIYTRADGGVSVIHPAPESRIVGESEYDWLERVAVHAIRAFWPGWATATDEKTAKADALTWAQSQWRYHEDKSKLPSRRFRNEWDAPDRGRVRVNPARARLRVLAEVRAKRNVLLAESDGEKHKLDDLGTVEQRAALRAYRQELRDYPANVEAQIAKLTVAELESFTPAFPAKAGLVVSSRVV